MQLFVNLIVFKYCVFFCAININNMAGPWKKIRSGEVLRDLEKYLNYV